jgi:hypothetical protein
MANGMSANKVSDFSRVNQRLLQAKFLLQQAQFQSQELLSPIQIEALINSVLWHLQSCLQFYVRELAGYSKLKNAWQLESFTDLSALLNSEGKSSQALDEILDLQSERASWLYRLQDALRNLSQSVSPEPETKAFIVEPTLDANQIPLVNLVEDDELHFDDLTNIIRELTQLIQRQRLVLAEF